MRRTLAAFAATAIVSTAAIAARPSVPAGFREADNGALEHAASGTVFPKALAGFTRGIVDALDRKGHDVSVGYRYETGGEPVLARIGLLHVEMMSPREHFTGMKPLVGTYFRTAKFTDIKPLDDGPLKLVGETRAKGWQGHFTASLNGKPYELSLSTVSFGYWGARFTAAYPVGEAKRARKRLTDLAVALIAQGPTRTPGK